MTVMVHETRACVTVQALLHTLVAVQMQMTGTVATPDCMHRPRFLVWYSLRNNTLHTGRENNTTTMPLHIIQPNSTEHLTDFN